MSDNYASWFDPSHPMNAPAPPRRPSISELEAILQRDDEVPIEILPNGEVRAIGSKDAAPKPLTYRENLGGEYGERR